MTFGEKVIEFYKNLEENWSIPEPFETIFPFNEPEVARVMRAFYYKFYGDDRERTFLYGINPGRFGAGVTGISFTDPVLLEAACGIPNDFKKRNETSSLFIYDMIDGWGGCPAFYKHFYITSICPIGFIKDGKNANYYDDKSLEKAVEGHITDLMWEQIGFDANRKKAFSIGRGTNFKRLKALNDRHGFFESIEHLPHPRWVMQYRRKKKDIYLQEYFDKLNKSIKS